MAPLVANAVRVRGGIVKHKFAIWVHKWKLCLDEVASFGSMLHGNWSHRHPFGIRGATEQLGLATCFLNKYSVRQSSSYCSKRATCIVYPYITQKSISSPWLVVYKNNLLSRHYLQKKYTDTSLLTRLKTHFQP